MSGYLSARIEGMDAVIAEFEAMDAQVGRASRRAVNKTARWGARQIARGIAADDAVPLRAIYKAAPGKSRKRVQMYLADRQKSQAGVWVGYNPIKAAYAGALRWTPKMKGARAGKHFFDRAFVATMKSGHRGVYLRKGAARLPIEEQRVPLASAVRHATGVARRLPARLADVFRQELNYEVNVRGHR